MKKYININILYNKTYNIIGLRVLKCCKRLLIKFIVDVFRKCNN